MGPIVIDHGDEPKADVEGKTTQFEQANAGNGNNILRRNQRISQSYHREWKRLAGEFVGTQTRVSTCRCGTNW